MSTPTTDPDRDLELASSVGRLEGLVEQIAHRLDALEKFEFLINFHPRLAREKTQTYKCRGRARRPIRCECRSVRRSQRPAPRL